MEWWELVSYVVGIAGIVIGAVFWTKWNQVVKLLKELGEAFTKSATALEDKRITKEEAVLLLKEWTDVVNAIRALLPASVSKLFIKPKG